MRRPLALAVLGALSLSLLVAAPAHAAGSFYDPPTSFDAAPGALIKTAPMRLAASVSFGGSVTPLPGTATQIMYGTTDADGRAAAATGVYIEPAKRWTGAGDRPLVSFAAGTQGQGDACAPSRTLQSGIVVSSDAIAIGYEIPSIYSFLARGIAVVVTDYIGLGMTDRVHSYVVRLDSGHAVLDAARAARGLEPASVTDASPIGLYGYSQGGGAVAAAAELAPSYAPELPIRGAFAGAPPADLLEVMNSADGSSLTGVVGFAFNAIAQYEPGLAAVFETELTPQGRDTLARLANACIGDALLTTGTAFTHTSGWTTTGRSFRQLADDIPAVREAVDAQRIGRLKPAVPVQVLTGTKDDIVAHAQAKQLAKDWCAQGVNVTYVPVVQPVGTGGTALNHLGPAITRGVFSQQWLVDRLQSRPVSGNCAALPLLP
ncbi:lipase [Microbacterium sp. W1N]|uniref:lipase family protein n=1 Tax=Microbacterium festucae TaxID=2977531 RepID=UPI0021BFAC45|nr:lipase family protein [Microbacterium festucae]MCT9820834.1 lipase [Microbacterium festucae]